MAVKELSETRNRACILAGTQNFSWGHINFTMPEFDIHMFI